MNIIVRYVQKISWAGLVIVIAMAFTSCKKDSNNTPAPPAPTPLATLGLYQYTDNTNKRIFIPITKLGDQTVSYFGIFDTGSSGMTIDANGILPASMITANGITVPTDSVVVNGITVTNKTAVMSYGDATSSTKEYGNLAYATVTVGNSTGSLTTKRIAFFLYYKVVDGTGKQFAAHSADVFGVGPSTGYTYAQIQSPLNGLTMPSGVTSGFKLAKLNTTSFTTSGAFVSGLLTVGLLQNDLNSAGFVMHPLTRYTVGGYSPNIPATITYNNTSTTGNILFDTGTPSVHVIENPKETNALGKLPAGSTVKITTNQGFTYTYTTTSAGNLTQIQNPNISGDYRTIMSLNFFTDNEFLTDYTNHKIGLKN